MKIDLSSLTIKKAHDHFMKGDFTAVELTQAYLDEIKKKNEDLNAYREVFDDARDAADGYPGAFGDIYDFGHERLL